MAEHSNSSENGKMRNLFKVRTITAFIVFEGSDFEGDARTLIGKVRETALALQAVRESIEKDGYEVQTVRIATNPFPEYLLGGETPHNVIMDEAVIGERLKVLDECLCENGIAFASLGPAHCPKTAHVCTQIIEKSERFSASVQLSANDTALAKAAARTALENSKLGHPDDGGLANFRFCVANLDPYVPFFPGAKAASLKADESFRIRFALGFENGALLKHLLKHSAGQTIANVLRSTSSPQKSARHSNFAAGFAEAIRPLQTICETAADSWNKSKSPPLQYIGIDASFNPSLEDEGSVAAAVEVLKEVPKGFGGVGTIAATAAMTTVIQTQLSSAEDPYDIKLTGYNGLMLPLCEDRRLAELASQGNLRITDLLNVSSVCGVGIDTVPVPGNADVDELASLYLDMAGLAERWNKPLSCRVFPVPNKQAGDQTTFDSPYLVNSKILPISR